MHTVFICEDSITGIFTGVYQAWASKLGHKNVSLSTQTNYTYQLFHEYLTVVPTIEQSEKVSRTILQEFGTDFYETICKAIYGNEKMKKLPLEKSNAIYQTLVMAFSLPGKASVLDYLTEPCIQCVFELNRMVSREAHHFLGFLRFKELAKSNILYGEYQANHNVLFLLAEHFNDRMGCENFIIHDLNYHQALIHRAHKGYLITHSQLLDEIPINDYSVNEDHYQSLFRTFFETIAIEERINPKLFLQNYPKRFWPNSVELVHRFRSP